MNALASIVPLVDPTPTPVDLSSQADAITTVLGGLTSSLTPVLIAGLSFAAIFWGIPKLVTFFKKTAK